MPAVPLARDLAAQQRTLRLKPEALEPTLDLDLRTDDRPGPQPAAAPAARCSACRGASRIDGPAQHRHVPRAWRLRWQPEFAVRAGRGAASTARPWSPRRPRRSPTQAREATVAGRGHRAGRGVPAGRPGATRTRRCCAALDTRAALDADVAHLLAASRRWPGPCATATCAAPTSAGLSHGDRRPARPGSAPGCRRPSRSLSDEAAAGAARAHRRRARRGRPARRRGAAGALAGHAGAGWPTATTCTACWPGG